MPRSRLWPDPRVKPPFGAAEIDWAHPLARGLLTYLVMNEGGGPPRDLVRPRSVTFVGNWKAGAGGLATRYDGSTGYASIPLDLSTLNKITVVALMAWDSFANDDDLMYEFTPNGNTNPGSMHADPNGSTGGGGGFFEVTMADVGPTYNAGYFTRPSATTLHAYALTYDRTTGVGVLGAGAYVDGIGQSMTAFSTTMASSSFANDTLYLMSRAGSSLFGAGDLVYLGVYDHILAASDALWLHAEPYAMLRPIVRRRYFVPAAEQSLMGAMSL